MGELLASDRLLAVRVLRVALVTVGLLVHLHALLLLSVVAHQNLATVHAEPIARGLWVQADRKLRRLLLSRFLSLSECALGGLFPVLPLLLEPRVLVGHRVEGGVLVA
jgi:hypothetical protein